VNSVVEPRRSVIGQRGHDEGALRGLGLLLVVLAVTLVAAPPAQAAPVVTYACSPAPRDCAGWFRSDVTVTWTVTPPEAATPGCAPVTFTADTSGAEATCTASLGPDTVTGRVTIRVDKTPPTVTGAAAMRAADVNGWYNHAVLLQADGSDATSGLADCPRVVTFNGPDSAAPTLAGICTDVAGNRSAPFALGLKYDATRPRITDAIPARPPDHAGWFTSTIRFDFSGTDATSGLAGCESASYSGPDAADASILGTCVDQAGNVSRRSFSLMFDATPPRISGLTATPGDRHVALRWQSSPDRASVEVVRIPGHGSDPESVVFTGPGQSFLDDQVDNGVRYVYRVRVADAAGNETSQDIAAVPTAPAPDTPPAAGVAPTPVPVPGRRRARLLSPAANATVRMGRPPLLRWMPVRRARYYNVQLFRGDRKVLSAWPARPRYQIKKRWTLRGTPQRLKRGRYRWYVWPGFGARPKARYGDLLGRRTFTVVGR
jgi:hypothetical protein